jgi:hypothetical protein
MRYYTDQDCTHRELAAIFAASECCPVAKRIVLLHVKVIGAWEVRAARKLDGQLGVVENVQDVRHHSLLINNDTKNLTAFVHANDTRQ